jgi:hypothetical protein
MRLLLIAMALAAFGLMGCSSSSSTIHVIDGLPKEVYLTVPNGAKLNVGDTYIVFHMQQTEGSSSGIGGHAGHAGHGGGAEPRSIRHVLGKVEVIRIADATNAEVKVLSGEVMDGVLAEKDN